MSGVAGTVRAALGDAVLSVSDGFGTVVVDVEAASWEAAVAAAAGAGAGYADFLTAYDDAPAGFAVLAHLSTPDARDHVLLRALIGRDQPAIATATRVLPGLAWHERETHELFGIGFDGHEGLEPLLLRHPVVGYPLRKEFALAARVATPWPGAKDPADGDAAARRPRRRQLPPGVAEQWLPEEAP